MTIMINNNNNKTEEKVSKPSGKKITPPQLVRGMHDILPGDWPWWRFVLSAVDEVALSYGFDRIDLPILEKTSLFTRAIGNTTDIVEKEMYSFVDQSSDHLSLRPEFTAGIARAYIEHGMLSLPQPVKLYAVGPLFRHERPQAGRYRQHWQLDFEVLGDDDSLVDAQAIMAAAALFKRLALPVTFNINSVGCPACRPRYRQALVEYYKSKKADLCPDCKLRLQKNPLRLLDCKEEQCLELKKNAPQLVDHLCDLCRRHFEKLLEHLDSVELAYQLNLYLVRGLDYYTRTVFEVWGEEGASSSLGGGGRYDNLIEELGGRSTPAIGFGSGIERIVAELKRRNITVPPKPAPDIFIASLGDVPRQKALKLFEELREGGIKVSESFTKNSLKAQLEVANKLGVSFALVLGQKELIDSTIIIRDMENGIQETIDLRKVASEITKRLTQKSSLVTSG